MTGPARLEYEFTYRTSVAGPEEVGNGPLGMRHCYALRDGVIAGARLSGSTLGGGADWMLVGADGFVRMDARIQVRTADGAILCVRYFGPAEHNAKLRAAIGAGKPSRFGDHSIRTHWLLETGDERYAWVNQSVMVGEGRFAPGEAGLAGFEHRVYRVA